MLRYTWKNTQKHQKALTIEIKLPTNTLLMFMLWSKDKINNNSAVELENSRWDQFYQNQDRERRFWISNRTCLLGKYHLLKCNYGEITVGTNFYFQTYRFKFNYFFSFYFILEYKACFTVLWPHYIR